MPWGVKDQVSSDFLQHLNTRHQFEYDTFVDYEQDEDEALKPTIAASLHQK
jgi:RING finger protein 114/RING finger protein 166